MTSYLARPSHMTRLLQHAMSPRIPEIEGALFLSSIKQAATEDFIASGVTASGLDGQFVSPVPDVLAGLYACIADAMGLIYAYTTYSVSMRGAMQGAIHETFEERSIEKREIAEQLTRKAAALGGGVHAQPVEPPPPLTDPVQIVEQLIQMETQAIQNLQALHKHLGEHPFKYEVENFLHEDQRHIDALTLLLQHSADILPPGAVVLPPAAPAEPAAQPLDAPKTAAMRAALALPSPGTKLAEDGASTGAGGVPGGPDTGGGQPAATAMAPQSSAGPEENAALSGQLSATGQALRGEIAAQRAAEQAALEYYQNQAQGAQTGLQQAQAEAQAAQQQAQQAQEQLQQLQAQQEQVMQQAQMVQQGAMANMQTAHNTATSALMQAQQLQDQLLQQSQAATNARSETVQIKTQLQAIAQLPTAPAMVSPVGGQPGVPGAPMDPNAPVDPNAPQGGMPGDPSAGAQDPAMAGTPGAAGAETDPTQGGAMPPPAAQPPPGQAPSGQAPPPEASPMKTAALYGARMLPFLSGVLAKFAAEDPMEQPAILGDMRARAGEVSASASGATVAPVGNASVMPLNETKQAFTPGMDLALSAGLPIAGAALGAGLAYGNRKINGPPDLDSLRDQAALAEVDNDGSMRAVLRATSAKMRVAQAEAETQHPGISALRGAAQGAAVGSTLSSLAQLAGRHLPQSNWNPSGVPHLPGT